MPSFYSLSIQFDSSSFYFIFSVVTSIIAIGIAIYFWKFSKLSKAKLNTNTSGRKNDTKTVEQETFDKYFKDENFFDFNTLNVNEIRDEDNDDENDTDSDSENAIHGLVGKLKSARLKKIEETLSEDQRATEKEVEREQLAAIFELLKKQEQEFNLNNMEEDDFRAQLNLYR